MTDFERAEIEKDFINAEDFFDNQTFNWNGIDYPCNPSSGNAELDLGHGGFNSVDTFKLTVRTSNFPNGVYPQSQDLLTFNGTQYAIAAVKTDINGIFLVLTIVSATRGP